MPAVESGKNPPLYALLAEINRRRARQRLFTYYPDKGPLRRDLYPKHMKFMAAGFGNAIRVVMAGNRTGKTEGLGLYELALHMTGLYPVWWKGKRFDRPVKVWVCGDTGQTCREILQPKLLGQWGNFGTGLIPGDHFIEHKSKQGTAQAVDTFAVRHVSGGVSTGVFKSYESGMDAFMGSEQDVILLDEEPPLDVYTECVVRISVTGGLILMTFTPLGGVTKLIKHLRESKVFEINATWDDVPHLSQAQKDQLWDNTPAYMREARSKGIPARGSGVVFQISEHTIVIPSRKLPDHWPSIGGLDFGYTHPMAAVKLVHDRDNDTIYLVGEKREKEHTPLMFAACVKSWGTWLPWAWPHDGLQRDKDVHAGRPFAELFRAEGMDMLPEPASSEDDKLVNSLEGSVNEMLTYMQSGRFKVMDHLVMWLQEFRDYYRKDGVIVKEDEDLISASRYAFMMRRHATCKPRPSGRPVRAPNWRTA